MVERGRRAGADRGAARQLPRLRRRGGREVPGVRRPHARAPRPPARHDHGAAYEAGVAIYAGTDAGGVLPHGRHRRRGARARGLRVQAGRRPRGRVLARRAPGSATTARWPRARPPTSSSSPRDPLEDLTALREPDAGACCAADRSAARLTHGNRPDFRRGGRTSGRMTAESCARGPSHPRGAGPSSGNAPAPPAAWPLTHTQAPRRHHTRGRQDSSEAHGQDPSAALPRRRRRLAARSATARSSRRSASTTRSRSPRSSRSPPTGRSTGWVSARSRPRPSRRSSRSPATGRSSRACRAPRAPCGSAEPKRDKTELFNEALKDAANEPKAGATTRKKTAAKAAPADEAPVAPPVEEKPAAEAPAEAAAEAPRRGRRGRGRRRGDLRAAAAEADAEKSEG